MQHLRRAAWTVSLCLSALAVMALVYVSGAHAAPQCGPQQDVLKHLKDKFGEEPRFSAHIAGGMNLTVTVAPSGGFSILVINDKGIACLTAVGDGWTEAGASPSSLPWRLPDGSYMKGI